MNRLSVWSTRSKNLSNLFHTNLKIYLTLYHRLSKIAGSKLTSNNPDIADLSDDNRPTKLAEKFSQLYDDAWTDSLEELTEVETKLDDTVAISFLLRIVMVSFMSIKFSLLKMKVTPDFYLTTGDDVSKIYLYEEDM